MSMWTRFWEVINPEPQIKQGEKRLVMVKMYEPTTTVINVNDPAPAKDDFDA